MQISRRAAMAGIGVAVTLLATLGVAGTAAHPAEERAGAHQGHNYVDDKDDDASDKARDRAAGCAVGVRSEGCPSS